jgi:hypothetical protein
MSMNFVRIGVRGFGITFATGFAGSLMGLVAASPPALAVSCSVVTQPDTMSATAIVARNANVFMTIPPRREYSRTRPNDL